MKKILHKLTYAQNPSQYEAHPSYYEEVLCKVLTVHTRIGALPHYLTHSLTHTDAPRNPPIACGTL